MIPFLCLWVSLVHFADPAGNNDVSWVNAPGREMEIRVPARLDAALDAGSLNGGLVTAGLQRITFRPRGEYVVEVFVIAQDPGRRSFLLEADREAVDSNLHLRSAVTPAPNAPIGYRTLVGIVHGPAELSVRSSASEYAISAIRWRTRQEYERDVIPQVVARARQLEADSSLIPTASERQRVLRQLWDRASLALDAALAHEAWIGAARAFYWEAMREPDPGRLSRLEELLQRAMRVGSKQDIVHQLVSSACTSANLPPGSPPAIEDIICKDAKPVYWPTGVPDRTDAPAWAEAQRKMRVRLDQIAAYWIDKRQRSDGSLSGQWTGDGAQSDAWMMRNWGALAAGLGSATAASGMERLANGALSSGLIANGYDKTPGPAEVSSRLTSGTLPYLALLRPEQAAARMRETAQCLPYWIRKEPDGAFRFEREGFNCRDVEPDSRYIDTVRNLQAVGPALWYASLSRDEDTITRLWYWAEAWAKAMRSNEGGKPAGVIPAEIFSADGSYREWIGDNWSADGQTGMEWLFAALYDLKGDRRWVAALMEAQAADPPAPPAPEIAIGREDDTEPPVVEAAAVPSGAVERRPDRGTASARGPIDRMGKNPLAGFFDHRTEWDGGATLAKLGQAYERRISVNLPMHTSEALFTDRVFLEVPEDYQRFLFGGAPPRPDRYPAFAVTWTPAREQYARAIIAADGDSVRMKLFNFESGVARADFRVWRLRPGRYRWMIAETKEQGDVEIDAARRHFSIPMAPGRELTVEIQRR